MPDPTPAPTSSARARPTRASITVDVLLLAPRSGRLHLLLRRAALPGGRARWECPWDGRRGSESLAASARRIAHSALGTEPAWSEQLAAFGELQHASGAELSVAHLALATAAPAEPAAGAPAHGPMREAPHRPGRGAAARSREDVAWYPVGDLPPLAPRQRAMVEAALRALPERLDHAPLAFHLVPEHFTLSELQEAYELLLGRALHKASFRRALGAAALAEPVREWRTEGRGRPAQLYRYAPKRRRRARRGVRFEGM